MDFSADILARAMFFVQNETFYVAPPPTTTSFGTDATSAVTSGVTDATSAVTSGTTYATSVSVP